MMRLLHVVPSYLPAVRYGGPVFAVHGLCRALVRAGHRVDVFTTSVDGEHDIDVAPGVRTDVDGVGVHYFPVPALRRWYWSPMLARVLRARVRDYDLVHAHALFLHPVSAAARAALERGVPYLVSPRGMLVETLFRDSGRLAKSAWLALIGARMLERAAAVHVTSAREAHDAAPFGLRLHRVVEVPNGIDPPAEAEPSRDPRLVLFLGRISWKKGLDRLLPAVGRVPQARLVVAGNDDEDRVRALRARASLPDLAGRVEFAGPVHGDAKWDLYRRAAVFVLPSRSENFANTVLEAMAAGCPVVVTPEVGLADAVREAGAGLVCGADPGALAAAIGSLLDDACARRRMGEAGRDLVARRFRWARVAAAMVDAYRGVLHEARAA